MFVNNNDDASLERSSFLKTIYARHINELRRYLRRSLPGNHVDAEDIAQKVFIKLASRKTLHDIENPRAYLYQVARHLIVDLDRKKARDIQLCETLELNNSDSLDRTTPEQIMLQHEELNVLEQVIRRLPPKRRRVFLLSRVHNMNYEEITRETGLSKAGVKQHIVRALADCRMALNMSNATKVGEIQPGKGEKK